MFTTGLDISTITMCWCSLQVQGAAYVWYFYRYPYLAYADRSGGESFDRSDRLDGLLRRDFCYYGVGGVFVWLNIVDTGE